VLIGVVVSICFIGSVSYWIRCRQAPDSHWHLSFSADDEWLFNNAFSRTQCDDRYTGQCRMLPTVTTHLSLASLSVSTVSSAWTVPWERPLWPQWYHF